MDNNTIPPVDYAPPELQGELITIQKFTTEDLLTIAESEIIESHQESQLPLLEENQNKVIFYI